MTSPVTSYGVTERPIFSYKLNENYKGIFPTSINGITLHEGWNAFSKHQQALQSYIRSYKNKNGMIDEKVEDSKNRQSLNTEEIYKTEKILYKREVLATYPRNNLIDISRVWGIDPSHKRDAFLINLILEEQEKYKFWKEQQKVVEKIDVVDDEQLPLFPDMLD